jgi:hypothetical protein
MLIARKNLPPAHEGRTGRSGAWNVGGVHRESARHGLVCRECRRSSRGDEIEIHRVGRGVIEALPREGHRRARSKRRACGGWKREMLGAVPTVAAVTVVVIVFDANAFGSDEIFTQKFAV